MRKIIIAIDGYSSCGKSTLAKQLAKTLNYIYIDTGAMHRAVALYALQNHFFKNGSLAVDLLLKNLSKIEVSFIYNNKTNTSETC